MNRWRALVFLVLALVAVALPAGAQEPEVQESPRQVLKVPESVLLGAPFLVRLTSLDPLEEASFNWLGRQVVPAVSVWNGKHVALAMLGSDVQTTPPGAHELVVVAVVDGERQAYARSVMVRERPAPEEPDRPAPQLTEAERERLAREARQAADAVDSMTPQRRWFLPLDRPVDAPVGGAYGAERNVGGRQTFRRGLDFDVESGTPVRACGTGTVVLVADHLLAGRSVYIDHGNGVVSMYFHLLRADVTKGHQLARGDVIGMSGASGAAEHPVLRFAVAVQGRLVDPQPLFNNNAEGLLPD